MCTRPPSLFPPSISSRFSNPACRSARKVISPAMPAPTIPIFLLFAAATSTALILFFFNASTPSNHGPSASASASAIVILSRFFFVRERLWISLTPSLRLRRSASSCGSLRPTRIVPSPAHAERQPPETASSGIIQTSLCSESVGTGMWRPTTVWCESERRRSRHDP